MTQELSMGYSLVVIGMDKANRLMKQCPDYPDCTDSACPLCDNHLVIRSMGCWDCSSGNRIAPDGPFQLGPTDAAEAYVFTFENQENAQAWIDSWPSPAEAFRGKLVYGFQSNFPFAPPVSY